ncbi:MAG: 2-amino-3-ketobutyrate CoA ligase, partial [Candidatus Eisenbacteria bacterium]|nr:2-amino-3-ketobutyrate CoA ligase [Candidatus Eisenbacteria bacterium]
MSVIDRLGKKLSSSSAVMRLISNDRVMQVATGIMDARGRLEAAAERASEAWTILLHGHALPTIDPALDGVDDVVSASPAKKSPAPAPAPSTAPTNGAATHGTTNGAG